MATKIPDGYEKAQGNCPYCLSLKKPATLVLQSGSASCLNCGKHWQGWQIGKTYSEALERKDQQAVAREEEIVAAIAKGKK